jgi:hypothetical protein
MSRPGDFKKCAECEYAAPAGTSDARHGHLNGVAWYSSNATINPKVSKPSQPTRGHCTRTRPAYRGWADPPLRDSRLGL